MLSYTCLKIVHLFGISLLLVSLGGLAFFQFNQDGIILPRRRLVAITHGIGMVLVLIGGFGMMGLSGIHWPWPGWVVAKLFLWLFFGALLALVRRVPRFAVYYWWGLPVLVLLSAWLALEKPF